jgi:hypothetical protein
MPPGYEDATFSLSCIFSFPCIDCTCVHFSNSPGAYCCCRNLIRNYVIGPCRIPSI